MNKNLKINLVMKNLDIYLHAKSVTLRSYLDLHQYSQYLRPEMDRITLSMKRLEVEARHHLQEMQGVR